MATTYSITNDAGETFTFDNAMILSYTPAIQMNEKDENVMPGLGAMSNQIYDYNDQTKTITITGVLFNTSVSVVNDGSPVAGFDNVLAMKYWLESLMSGAQIGYTFVSPQDQYTLSSTGGTTTIPSANIEGADDDVVLQGAWVATKVYVVGIEFPDAEENVGIKLPFTITFEVAT